LEINKTQYINKRIFWYVEIENLNNEEKADYILAIEFKRGDNDNAIEPGTTALTANGQVLPKSLPLPIPN